MVDPNIEALRSQIRKIFYKFDYHLSPFSGANYVSPFDFLLDGWSQRVGCDQENLLKAIFVLRHCKVTKTKIPNEFVSTLERFQNEVQAWKEKNKIERSPFDYRSFANKKYQKAKINRKINECFNYLELEGISQERGSREAIFGEFSSKFDLRVNTSISVDYKNGGELSFSFLFPLYNHDSEPTALDSWNLLGQDFFYTIGTKEIFGIDPPAGSVFFVDQDDDSFPDLLNFIKIFEGVVSCLRFGC